MFLSLKLSTSKGPRRSCVRQNRARVLTGGREILSHMLDQCLIMDPGQSRRELRNGGPGSDYKTILGCTINLRNFANLPEKKSQDQHAVTEEVMAQTQWLKPEQSAEIEFVARTSGGRLRHASFRRPPA